LLIPAEQWETLSNVRVLNDLFRNPHGHSDYSFTEAIDLPAKARIADQGSFKLDLARSRVFVSRYFGQGLRPIIWFNAGEPEEYLWRLLEHLWPKLRNAFACCTFSLQQRALQDRPFDLLFAPAPVYSRFTKLLPEHIIEPTLERKILPADAEPWSQYWAEAFFSSQSGLPTHETELPIWAELGEDPTAVRKLSLVHELRLRAAQSPTAGVGAIDLVESLARDADAAVPLKQLVFQDAIAAASSARPVEDGLTSLRLIEDRLRRESFRNVAADSSAQLTSAVAAVTSREPGAAVQLSSSLFTEGRAADASPFVRGVIVGLCDVAKSAPSRLQILGSHPEMATEIFRLEPMFASTFLHIGGDTAPHVVAEWLKSIDDTKTVGQVRKALLPAVGELESEELLSAILRGITAGEVEDTLDVLSEVSRGFASERIRDVIEDRIALAFPDEVKNWGASARIWTRGVTLTVASAYEHNRHGIDELLEKSRLTENRKADVLAAMLSPRSSSSIPYWLREIMSNENRIVETLLRGGPDVSAEVEAALSKALSEVSDISLPGDDDFFALVFRFEGRPVFPQLFDAAMQSGIESYVAGGEGSLAQGAFLCDQRAARWLQSAPGSQVAALLVRGSKSGAASVTRAMKWIAEAPQALYARHPSVLPELCESVLSRVRQFHCAGAADSMVRIVQRAGPESGFEVRQVLSAKLLRFCLDNVRLPLGAVVAEVFSDVYSEALKEDDRPQSILKTLFGIYDWDKGKDLRIALIDAFLRSDWRPGDLAIAASNARILRKIFKRLHRSGKGDNYLRSMLRDLSQRTGSDVSKIQEDLQLLMADPEFYEEWD
jgi:hypothetical protein